MSAIVLFERTRSRYARFQYHAVNVLFAPTMVARVRRGTQRTMDSILF